MRIVLGGISLWAGLWLCMDYVKIYTRAQDVEGYFWLVLVGLPLILVGIFLILMRVDGKRFWNTWRVRRPDYSDKDAEFPEDKED